MKHNYNNDSIKSTHDLKLIKRLLKFTKPFKIHIFMVILMILAGTILNLSRPYLIKNTIDNDINGFKRNYTILSTEVPESVKVNEKFVIEGSNANGIPATIINKGKNYYLVDGKIDHTKVYTLSQYSVSQNNTKYNIYKLTSSELKLLRKNDLKGVKLTALYILIICITLFILNFLQTYILQYVGQKIVFNMREILFKHIENLSLSFFDKNPVGRLVTRVTNDIEGINDMYTSALVNIIQDAFLLTGLIAVMFLLNVKLAVIALISVPFIIIISLIFKRFDRKAYRKVRENLAKINSSLSENISGIKTVQIFNKEDKKFKEFDDINSSYLKVSLNQITAFAVFRPAIDFLSSLALSGILWFGGLNVMMGEMHFGILYAFVSYLMQFFQPIFDLAEKYDIIQSAMASSERVFTLLDNYDIIPNTTEPKKIDKFNGKIEFKNVWFAYDEENWVLKNVSFTINPGEKVAFVGATGAGKTSIISLISRLYDVQKGEILVDGINIKCLDKYELRKNIASVLQDVFLFAGDIKSNIRLSNSLISDEEIVQACKYVNADSFIEKLPYKYNSYVTERGSTFSNGERQLIAFARAIAFNPPILVLDEATSNIDTDTEVLIQDALKKITKNRTTIMVAHRLSTIKNSDKIIVLNKGVIRETGTHEELLAKGNLYYNLYKLQYENTKNQKTE